MVGPQSLQQALNNAEEVLADSDATQEEVDAALEALENGREGLVKSGEVTIVPSVGVLRPTATDGVHTITMDNSTRNISFSVNPADPDALISIGGQPVERGAASDPIALNVGLNEGSYSNGAILRATIGTGPGDLYRQRYDHDSECLAD